MAKTKAQKKKIIEDLKEKIEKQKSIVFLNIAGIKAKELSKLRSEMKEKDCQLKIVKKTLLEKAFQEKGMEIETKRLKGEIALAFGFEDEISPFKISYDFSKEAENLEILGGIFEGKIIDQKIALTLAALPTKEEILAKMIGSLSAPISNFLNTLKGNFKNLIYLLSQLKVEKP